MKNIVFILIIFVLFSLTFENKLLAVIDAQTFISKKSIYDFQSMFLTIKLEGDYDSISSAGYLDETLLNDFEIKNVNVSTSSYIFENGDTLYSRIMRYEIMPIRPGKSMIPSINILYDDGENDGYITTQAMPVRVYGKAALIFHIFLFFMLLLIVAFALIIVIVGIRNARKSI